ncbi:hypothetical protein D1825_17755 [Cellulomonas rhizosphaerae]|uniref:Uncharacterized protein n=1 Tax=Cellulomonas rhizosphaerae TaxID=2293719 RepID=A0A413RH55_9CELL|nr:hypothetical protein D1825_17755 [Cellulomonas rhizosphaerae]
MPTARRSVVEATRDVAAAFLLPQDDATEAAWEAFGDVEEILAVLAGGLRRSGLTSEASVALDKAVRRFRGRDQAGTTADQRDVVERLLDAVATTTGHRVPGAD